MYFFRLIVLLLLIGSSRANIVTLISDPLADSVCASANCGQGTCKPALIGYDCECFAGWKQVQIGLITLTSTPCIFPNCTSLDSGCGTPSPLPPPPPFNLSNPCTFTWCGDGTCVTNGTGYTCKCNAGSDNLMNLTGLACFKDCSFGGDCDNSVPLPSPSSNASPPPNPSGSSGSNDNGSIEVLYHSGIRFALTLLPVSALLLSWF